MAKREGKAELVEVKALLGGVGAAKPVQTQWSYPLWCIMRRGRSPGVRHQSCG
jgi:hypothetical protein